MSKNRGVLFAIIQVVVLCCMSSQSRAQSYNVLKECSALSNAIDEIHSCLDNYLDIMDRNIADITAFFEENLSEEALQGLQRSQSAFVEYRRQNCLWYLDFSFPRTEAEQIAKNCLATMSQQRWEELQTLLTEEDTSGQILSGYYVFGAGRNSFQLCGSEDRYWLEGDGNQVDRAQQLYTSLAVRPLQALHAVFAGKLDTDTSTPPEHEGVFQLDTLIDLSLPTESECELPGNLTLNATSSERLTGEALRLEAQAALEEQKELEQQLTAYFGAWLVDCTESNDNRACKLQVALQKPGDKNPADLKNSSTSMFVMHRKKHRVTELELIFPDREIDSASRVRWSVDATKFGDIVNSEIRVDESASRLLVPESQFLRNELLPELLDGSRVYVEVLESVDDDAGEAFVGTLLSLTKAVRFSDDFVREAID